jgi:chloramphenicol 3-O-phosphotransferase
MFNNFIILAAMVSRVLSKIVDCVRTFTGYGIYFLLVYVETEVTIATRTIQAHVNRNRVKFGD